jgi:hypothetical protein
MLEKTTIHTNEEIESQKTRYQPEQSYPSASNTKELTALIELLYLSGVIKKAHLSTEDMWCKSFGPPPFRASMRINRFKFLLNSQI